ncbi:MAG: hypothetical protein JWR38_3848 [Mucilaginibacter sp.]|nr:hypothetical protein [Mucilaginibacter sp.]
MDIANYLSELLGRHGKISVPDLGFFTQVRVDGYYNDAEGKFYPPGYRVQFSPEPVKNDDTLAYYIAEKKNISLASSKYFTEKYITGLKQELTTKEAAFADMGWFYINEGQIAFRPNEQHGNEPNFYGYAPVAIKKLHQEPETQFPEKLLPDSSTPTETLHQEPEAQVVPETLLVDSPAPNATANQPEEYIDDEQEEKKRSISGWVIALIILVIVAAAAYALYQYNPGLFFNQKTAKPINEQPKQQPATIADSAKIDTQKIAPAVSDSSAKAISKPGAALNKPVASVDTVAKPEYVIFAGSFRTKTKSELAVENYKSIGIEARLLTGAGTGRLIKVIIGHFATYNEGEAERLKLTKSGKLRKDSYTQIINQKK